MAKNIWPLGIVNGGIAATAQPTFLESADANHSKWVAQFSASAENRLHYHMYAPPNVAAGADLTVRILWRANAVTGNAVWQVYARVGPLAQSLNAAAASTETATTTTDATAYDLNETVITFTPADFAASRSMSLSIARLGADGADDLAVTADVEEIVLEWEVDVTMAKGYIWVPASAMVIPGASGCSFAVAATATDNGAIIKPKVLVCPDAAGSYADFRFTLPSNYLSGLRTRLLAATESAGGTGTIGWHIDMAAAAVGAARDPALSVQSTFTLAYPGATAIANDATGQAAVITPSAGQEILCRVTRDSGDASTAVMDLYGILIEFNLLTRSPAVIDLMPSTAALPANGASIAQVGDTNTTKVIAQFSDGGTRSVDVATKLPSTYGSGGVLRLRWTAPTASTAYAYWRVDEASPAVGSASDPALVAGTAGVSANAGSGLINEHVVDVSSGLVAGDMFHARVSRLAGDAFDTLDGVTVDLIGITLEYVPA